MDKMSHMPADFSYQMYIDLIDEFTELGFSFISVRDYLTRDSLPERFVILRHDIDRKPGNALDFARIEANRDAVGTYYFRTVKETLVPSIIQEIESLGHEIGYHYEDLDRAKGDVEKAHSSFEAHLERLREVATVDTICMHGNPLTPHDNRDIWDTRSDFDTYGLVGEAYLSLDFSDIVYYSDTGRSWRDGALKVKDHTIGPDTKVVQVSTTPELIAHLHDNPSERYCLLTHPERWTNTPIERVTETSYDALKNTAKYVLHILSGGN